MLWQVSAAETECYAMANIGQSVSSNGWRQYQTIVDKMVTRRAEVVTAGGNYIPVIGWRLNKVNRHPVKYIFRPFYRIAPVMKNQRILFNYSEIAIDFTIFIVMYRARN